jgi:metal-responsive CopG/Arc/MetJ family transcriptional regulator
MKTAVSVPDELFRLAEVAARRLRVSRSQLYATAVSEFLNRRQGGEVTERLNEVYSRRPAKVDSALHRAQLSSIEKDSW